MKRIYTIGSSNRTLPQFLALLDEHGIQTLVDVRSWPRSKRFAHFNRESLAPALESHNLTYLHLGRELGGMRREGYEAYMVTDRFQQEITNLESIATGSCVCFMCAEKDPTDCHRRFIAAELEERGWEVVHIIDPGKTRRRIEEQFELRF